MSATLPDWSSRPVLSLLVYLEIRRHFSVGMMSVRNTLNSKPWDVILDDEASLGSHLLGMKLFLSEIQKIGHAWCVFAR